MKPDLSVWCYQNPKEAAGLIRGLRGALATIYNNTEPEAIRHADYDHLAANICQCAKAALDGPEPDDMHAAEVYDQLRRQAALGDNQQSSPPL